MGNNNLTVTGAAGATSGIVGNAVVWGGGVGSAGKATTTGVGLSTTSYSMGCWFRRTAISAQCILLDWSNTVNKVGFDFVVLSANLALRKSANGSLAVDQIASVSTNDTNWHFAIAWVDTAANTINIQIDDGVIASTTLGVSTTFVGGTLSMGNSIAYNAPANKAFMDQAFYYNRALSAIERTALYNSGAGRSFASL
ncbi:MAG: hypothetical protein JWP44_5149 [Mucilaginibacter sp.]|nr:hypothetical protein [Mucilaginibacter sp.]